MNEIRDKYSFGPKDTCVSCLSPRTSLRTQSRQFDIALISSPFTVVIPEGTVFVRQFCASRNVGKQIPWSKIFRVVSFFGIVDKTGTVVKSYRNKRYWPHDMMSWSKSLVVISSTSLCDPTMIAVNRAQGHPGHVRSPLTIFKFYHSRT